MIFYFSGMGNSKWIAMQLVKVQREELFSMATEMLRMDHRPCYSLKKNEKIGFVFPIYF